MPQRSEHFQTVIKGSRSLEFGRRRKQTSSRKFFYGADTFFIAFPTIKPLRSSDLKMRISPPGLCNGIRNAQRRVFLFLNLAGIVTRAKLKTTEWTKARLSAGLCHSLLKIRIFSCRRRFLRNQRQQHRLYRHLLQQLLRRLLHPVPIHT